MIRKMLVIAAAVAMPAGALAGITAVGGSSIAGAAAKVYATQACALTGSVTFASPGESVPGAITNKTVEKSSVDATPSTGILSGTGTGDCGAKGVYKEIKEKINVPTSVCWATAPVYVSKTDFSGGILANAGYTGPHGTYLVTAAAACNVDNAADSLSDPANTGFITPTYTAVKTAAKDLYYYDDAAGYASTTPPTVEDDIAATLGAHGIKAVDNGNAVTLSVGETGGDTIGSVQAGTCSDPVTALSLVGFQLTGTTNVPGLTYQLDLCLTTDTGGTSGAHENGFSQDITAEVLGSDHGIITAATIGDGQYYAGDETYAAGLYGSNLSFTCTGADCAS